MNHDNDFHERFDAVYNARRDYAAYRGQVDETENLPSGIYASIIRYSPNHPSELEPDDPIDSIESNWETDSLDWDEF